MNNVFSLPILTPLEVEFLEKHITNILLFALQNIYANFQKKKKKNKPRNNFFYF